jgi:integrase
MRAKLTAPFVESMKPPERGQIEYWDRKTPGFALRVSQGGQKAWVLLYRHQGRLRRLTLGTYPILGVADARDMAKARLAEVQQGNDPATAKRDRRESDTFAALSDRYLTEYARSKKRASSVHEDEKMLRRELLPIWGARKAGDITRRDVIALVDGIAARGAGIAANRTLALASKIFNFAVSKEVIDVNPAYRVPKPGREQARTRTLRDEEISAVWHALEDEPRDIAALFKVLLLTGQRRGEVVGMRWNEVDLEAGWWELPRERSKNGRAHRVPLVGRVSSILAELAARRGDSQYVFPGRYGRGVIVNFAKPLARIIERADVAAFSVHDLRRTCATGMAKAGVAPAVISKVLNHLTANTGASRITELHYAKYSYDAEKKAALLRWDGEIARMISGDPQRDNVIALRSA